MLIKDEHKRIYSRRMFLRSLWNFFALAVALYIFLAFISHVAADGAPEPRKWNDYENRFADR